MVVHKMNSPTSARRIVARARESTALEMRAGGATYRSIAQELNVSPPAAFKAVTRAISKMVAANNELARNVVELELIRLDRLLFAIWPAATERGSLEAVDRVLKIMERRSKFLGLDAPVKTVVGDMGEAEFLNDLANSVLGDPENQKLLDSLVARATKQGPGPICENPSV